MNLQQSFVSDQITPVAGTFDTRGMARGEPGFPRRFIWRNEEYIVGIILDKWKELTPCKSGSKEKYVRKHWFKIKTTNGYTMEIYFERKAKIRSKWKSRWWLYSVSDGNDDCRKNGDRSKIK